WQVRIVATELIFEQQADLFDATVEHNERNEINQLMDQINARYGELTIAPSRLVKRSTMPNVITPTWRPG
ncbi:MAG TPA: DNA polymerase IV, partial [Gammaproteobacteria bacterium]|nr:DNA polymerase IV [Gammaproteobacteria bacterium]